MGSTPIDVKINPIRYIAIRNRKDAYFSYQSRRRSSGIFGTCASFKGSNVICAIVMSLFPFFSMVVFRTVPFSYRGLIETRWMP